MTKYAATEEFTVVRALQHHVYSVDEELAGYVKEKFG